ncbi:hypothetical protein [Verrucosispora sp. TAA-831]|uniref:hypothetical protein n=1 Tax=Verrucosispora sp. TAA-831 TaxID=3422227 RepID=UPI003D701C08
MIEYLRLSGAAVQTPIYRYRHPDTGRRVTLVAAMHVGMPAYFTGLLDTIGDAEERGAVVHSEFIRSQPIPPDVTEEERRVLETLKSGGPCEDRAIATLG